MSNSIFETPRETQLLVIKAYREIEKISKDFRISVESGQLKAVSPHALDIHLAERAAKSAYFRPKAGETTGYLLTLFICTRFNQLADSEAIDPGRDADKRMETLARRCIDVLVKTWITKLS